MSDETIRVSRRTSVDIPMAEFGRPEPRLRTVGVLTPVVGVVTTRFIITAADFVIGRERGVAALVPDDSVSRHHARIVRKEDAFILEDLGSINGTFVDGVPILSVTLRDGDAIQIGHNLFYFDRLLELIEPGDPSLSGGLHISPTVNLGSSGAAK